MVKMDMVKEIRLSDDELDSEMEDWEEDFDDEDDEPKEEIKEINIQKVYKLGD